jgi:hypothetical protein
MGACPAASMLTLPHASPLLHLQLNRLQLEWGWPSMTRVPRFSSVHAPAAPIGVNALSERPASITMASTWEAPRYVVAAAIGERALLVGEAGRARSQGSALVGASFKIWR